MSSSGIGGSNGHVVLEAPPDPHPIARCDAGDAGLERPVLIMVGGLSPRSTAALAEQISDVLCSAAPAEWPASAASLGRRAKQMSWRSFAVCSPGSNNTLELSKPQHSSRDRNSLVFVFSGQGPQHVAMGRELFGTFPVFRDSILEMDTVFTRVTGKSMIYHYGLFASASPCSASDFPSIWPISLTLPAIAMFQIAFFDLLVYLSVKPDVVLGHSAGETALLCASGAAPKAMAVELAIIRGRIFSQLETAGGTMAALSCGPKEAESLLAEHRALERDAIVELACLNAPAAVAVSGQECAIGAVLERAKAGGIFGTKIRTFVPIHSSMMDGCREQYVAEVRELFERYPGEHRPTVPTYSTLTGRPFAGPFDAEYYWNNTRSQVLFTPVIQELCSTSTFVEISPHPVLSSYLSAMAVEPSIVLSTVVRPSNKPGKPASSEHRDVLQFFGKLTTAGHNCVDFTVLNGALCSELKIEFPPYPFIKKQFPLYPEFTTEEHSRGPLNRSRLRVNRDTHPTFAQHVIRGEPIWPAAAFLEMALEFGATALFNVKVHSMLSLSSEAPLPVSIVLDGAFWELTSTVPVRPGKRLNGNRLHADGYLTFEAPPNCEDLNIPEIRGRCHSHVDSDFYPSLAYFSSYGPLFQRVTNVYYNLDEALVSIRGVDASLQKEPPYISHPAIVDAVFQVAAYRPFTGDFDPNSYYLPSRIMAMILHLPSAKNYFPAHVYAHVRAKGWTPDTMSFQGTITNDRGAALCTLHFELAQHRMSPQAPITLPLHTVLQSVAHKPRSAESCATVTILESLGYSFAAQKSPSGMPYLILDAQKPSLPREAGCASPIFNDKVDFVFDYDLGDEAQLQWHFMGLNPLQELRVWILAVEGPSAAAGMGVVRSLRREYLYWQIRFVSFPPSITEKARKAHLAALPSFVESELEIIFSPAGDILVPRLVPLVCETQPPLPPKDPSCDLDLNFDNALVTVEHTVRCDQFTVVFASVIKGPDYHPGTRIVGLQQQQEFTSGRVILSLESMCAVPSDFSFMPGHLDVVPGLLAGVLALPPLSSSRGINRSRPFFVLVSHSDTAIGSIVCQIYEREGVKHSRTTVAATLLDLSQFGSQIFDLIVSGYSDKEHTQILRSLLRPSTGRLFLWTTELPRVLLQEPSKIADTLHVAFSKGYSNMRLPAAIPAEPLPVTSDISRKDSGATFSADRTYILLGGLGNIGAHVALYMVQRGARRIVATSRSGAKTLERDDAVIVRRIYLYLQSLDFLDIRLVAVDATSDASMGELFASIPFPIGGCIVLTATLRDSLFPNLLQHDFNSVFAAKVGVLKVLQRTTNISAMDFVLAFSSAVTVLGTGGQTSYCAANLALEQIMSTLPNGFAFVCPAIHDSTVMHEGSTRPSRLTHLVNWAMSQEELLLWIDDALSKFQGGARFHQYMPSMKWEAFSRTKDMPHMGAHLIPSADDAFEDKPSESEPITAKVERVICSALNVSDDSFDADVPLTSYGIDSLSAGRLSFALRGLIQVTQLQLLGGNSLADLIRKYSPCTSESEVGEATATAETTSTVQHTRMEQLVHEFSIRLEALHIPPITDQPGPPSSAMIVLLTGSTGALGCHLLSHLLTSESVRHVYALNRASTGEESLLQRQKAALHRQRLPPSITSSSKLTLLAANLADKRLGLPSETADELLSSVTHIIHNAWRIDFLAPLSEYEPLIAGIHHLLEFAADSTCAVRPSLSFMSTHGISRNLPASLARAPESIITDARVAVASGYTESKWVGERLVQLASQKRYVNANVVRVGQLSGSAAGAWETWQWVPALAQSGQFLGCLPDGDDTVSWIPIDTAAAAVVDMLGTMNETLHLVHPQPTTWRAVMQPLATALGVPLVPYAEWFARLKATADFAGHGARSLEALKMLDFFQQGLRPIPVRESMGLAPKVAMYKGTRASQTLQGDDAQVPLGAEDVEKWVHYWREIGFL
ncbi:acyl transferase domain-containing protein, partial [Mycena pura]